MPDLINTKPCNYFCMVYAMNNLRWPIAYAWSCRGECLCHVKKQFAISISSFGSHGGMRCAFGTTWKRIRDETFCCSSLFFFLRRKVTTSIRLACGASWMRLETHPAAAATLEVRHSGHTFQGHNQLVRFAAL